MSNEQNDNNNPTKVDEYEKDDDINENIKELFDQYDLNKTGFIELADIKEMFSKLGKDLVKIDE
jgi:Ca2+-binding EF-hand superfamily protein